MRRILDIPSTDIAKYVFVSCKPPEDRDPLEHAFKKYADLMFENRAIIQQAIELAVQYGQIDGAHHKTWVIDQILRILAGDQYESIIADAKSGVDGPDTYGWDEGIAP